MANKVEDDLRDDNGERGAENDTQNSDPHGVSQLHLGDKVCAALAFSILCDQRER